MSKFSVGEVAIINGFTINLSDLNGCECEIVGVAVKDGLGNSRDYAIIVDSLPTHHLGHWCIDEKNLRKKKPRDIDKTVEWGECLWQPEEITI